MPPAEGSPGAEQSTPPGSGGGERPRLFYGWTIVGVSALATFSGVAFFNPVLGVLQPALHDEFGWTRAEIAAAITIGSVGGGLASPLLGAILDRYGARWVMAGSAIAMVIALLLLAQQRELWQFYGLYGLGRALSVGALGGASAVAISNWFIRRRAFAIAIGTLGQRLGVALLPLLVALVIAEGAWPGGFRALAVVVLVLAVAPPLLLMKRRPEDVGLLPDGDAAPEDGAAAAILDPPWRLRAATRTRAYWLVGFATALGVFANGSVNFHMVPHMVDQGLSTTDAALVVTVLSSVGAAGALLGGVVATKFRPRWTMAGAMAMQAGGIALLQFVDGVGIALVYAVWFGLFIGAMVTQLQVVYADYFGRLQLGLIRGSFAPVTLAFNAAGPLIVGLWFDRAGSYTGAFALIAVCYLAAASALALASYPELPAAEVGG